MNGGEETYPTEDFISAHSRCFDDLIRKVKYLQATVRNLEASLIEAKEKAYMARKETDITRKMADKAREDADEPWQAYDKITKVCNALFAS